MPASGTLTHEYRSGYHAQLSTRLAMLLALLLLQLELLDTTTSVGLQYSFATLVCKAQVSPSAQTPWSETPCLLTVLHHLLCEQALL